MNNQDFSEQAKQIKIGGQYRHFKGGTYEVLNIARDSENKDKELVVYKSLDSGSTWVRPPEMFLENVERGEYNGPRFVLIDK